MKNILVRRIWGGGIRSLQIKFGIKSGFHITLACNKSASNGPVGWSFSCGRFVQALA